MNWELQTLCWQTALHDLIRTKAIILHVTRYSDDHYL